MAKSLLQSFCLPAILLLFMGANPAAAIDDFWVFTTTSGGSSDVYIPEYDITIDSHSYSFLKIDPLRKQMEIIDNFPSFNCK